MKFTRFEATMIRGDTEPLSIFLTEEDGKTVIPFADGDSVFFTIKKNSSDEDIEAVLQKTITKFELDGTAYARIEHEDTKNILAGKYIYDVRVIKANGDVKTIIPSSTFNLLQEVTNLE